MFLVRSAFWLSAAFIVMAPTAGMDVGQVARSTGEQLVSQGAQAVTSTLMPASCGSIECAVGRAVIGRAAEAVRTAQSPAVVQTAAYERTSFPPPRPAWAY